MPNPNKVFTGNLNKENFNFLFLFNLIIAFIGMIYLAWNGIDAGVVYSLMFFGVISAFVLLMLFLSNDNTMKPITDYVKIPISTNLPLGSLFYIIGIGLPFLIDFLIRRVSSFSITSFSVPLFGSDIIGGQTLSSAVIGQDISWKLFNIMFVAGNMETFVYNFGAVLVGILIGVLIFTLATRGNNAKTLLFMSKRTFVLSVGLLFSVLLFVGSHLQNQSYGTAQFIVAGIFIFIANYSIYLAGVFLLFWAGYHQSNNLIWLIQTEGLKEVVNGFFTTWFGIFFLIYFLLIIYYLLNHSGEAKKKFMSWISS